MPGMLCIILLSLSICKIRLSEDGSLREPGWSKSLVQTYDRKQIKAPRMRIKEWDYYLVLNEDFAGAFTLSDDGYIGLQSVSLLNFKEGWEHTETILNAFPMGKMQMPSDSRHGDIVYRDKRLHMEYTLEEGQRRIRCKFDNFYQGKTFRCDITLVQPKMDTMVIATPWKEKKTAFYYNQKINCMPAKGKMEYDGKIYRFDPSTDFGTLDWGRGVWTYDNRRTVKNRFKIHLESTITGCKLPRFHIISIRNMECYIVQFVTFSIIKKHIFRCCCSVSKSISDIKSTENDDKYTVKKKRGTDGRNTKKNHISRKGTGRRVPLYGQAGSRISWSYRMGEE